MRVGRPSIAGGWVLLVALGGAATQAWAGHPPPLLGEDCPSLDGPFIFFWDEFPEETPGTIFCGNEGCNRAELSSGPRLEKTNPLCDPQVQNCTLQLRVPLLLRGVAQNHHLLVNPFHPRLIWFKQDLPDPGCTPTSSPLFCSNADCGGPGGTFVDYDDVETYIQVGGLRCSNLTSGNLDVYSLSVFTCWDQAACLPASQRRFDLPGVDFTSFSAALALKCRKPRMDSCDEPSEGMCRACFAGGASAGGGGPAVSGGGLGEGPTGPGARLRYLAGGAGALGAPASPELNLELGRFWMHDYAERIVPDPDAGHVWLITRYGTFREWTDADEDGDYEDVAPSDEYRSLAYTGSGWTLRDLDGTVDLFDGAGRWLSRTDRSGNQRAATYAAGRLTEVSFPDGRTEEFAYTGGRLTSIVEVGVDGTSTRTWTYVWSGLDLQQIQRPDGTKLELFYSAPHPGYLERMELVGTDNARRVLRAWSYGGSRNVIRTWRGDASFTGPNAVDKWQVTYNAALPTLATVTDPLGRISTYTIARDTVSDKPKVTEISGDCPVCGLGPNAQLSYDDPDHPLKVTREVDGEGNERQSTYDGHGMRTSLTEAVGEPEERVTEWEYHPTFPAFVTAMIGPTATGATPTRRTDFVYDSATGDLEMQIASGEEATYPGGAFVLTTSTAYNGGGKPLTVDPPGFDPPGPTDVITIAYDATRGNGFLVPLTRSDPVVGAIAPTVFAHDAFNRRTGVTDPNGVLTETRFDPLDRVTHAIERSADGAQPGDPILPADLVTEHIYNAFGDLDCTVLPRGNALRYLYDSAGRMTEVRRGTAVAEPSATACLDPALPRERTLYTLDAVGHRTNEKQERWNGSAWVTEAETSYVYATRCHLDQVIQAPGRPEEAVTEYLHDCNGRLSRVWDANHPSAGQTAPATQVYGYDPLDRLVALAQPWTGAGGGSAVTAYGYDFQDHLTAVTDAEGNTTTYVVSDRDLLTSEVSPVSGTTTHRYNDHGELVETTDARGVTMTRTVDPLDRVTAVDYPTAALDVTYTYDVAGTCAASEPVGRLSAITRDGESVAYCHDRFGRMLRDGGLAMSFDENGNRTAVVYPGGVTAVYAHDFADRESSLTVQRPGLPDQPVVTAASYKPSGPLSTLAFGNGLAETRTFDARYAPVGIALSGISPLLDWDYSTDDVGNIMAIADALAPAAGRSFGYQDIHYFLSCAAGPWAPPGAGCAPVSGQPLQWTYDRIGNRLSETRAGVTDTYLYAANGGGGNTPILDQVQLGAGGSRTYEYGPAGHLEEVDAAGNLVLFSHDDAGQLGQLSRPAAPATARMSYDGRAYLRLAEALPPAAALGGTSHGLTHAAGGASQVAEQRGPADVASDEGPRFHARGLDLIFADDFETGDHCRWDAAFASVMPACPPKPPPAVQATYSSEGMLYALAPNLGPDARYVLWFAGRPAATLAVTGDIEEWRFLTTDHLGTPVVSTLLSGEVNWSGGFEPFGRDWQEGTLQSAERAEVFLRLPGQWLDRAWEEASLGAEVFYNLFRWYEPSVGSYTRADPVPGRAGRTGDHYRYALNNPLRFLDPLGLFEIDLSCNDCVHPYLARDNRQLSQLLLVETGAFCRERLNGIQDVNLRKCITQSCFDGKIVCSKGGDDCDDGLVQGYTPALGGLIGHALRRSGTQKVVRTAVICATNPLNFAGEAGDTVIHEWAHGCGYDADGRDIPGIPSADPPR